ncbi:LuxE/PaaK family acyltransferase [Fulvivirga lutea]|uniref:Acyl transferase n=1 Tax=Fulvivirga lutea TaxID=2810512 RepID=A0A975A0D9_9BACT|nr:acyl transferase [Fulvivirga lutea]QSE97161.1 acyl transferase [Fulvivirga lutea]
MDIDKSFEQKLIQASDKEFEKLALQVFQYQYKNNAIYHQYISSLGVNVENINQLEEIPFLPIQFFKSHSVKSGTWNEEEVFESSGTTGQITSKHYLKSSAFYRQNALNIFNQSIGNPSDYHIMALLPSYLERGNSSLVKMVKFFIDESRSEFSGFYLNNHKKLVDDINSALKTEKRILLIGVTFALLDIAEKFNIDLAGHIIMETGGMKGRRKEMTRMEVHTVLKKSFNVATVYSEYGMTELLSQAYSAGNGLYKSPDTMRILLRDLYDPFYISNSVRQGGINVIDLANVHTCSFIETQDIGRISGEFFEVLGRYDNSELRGCNLMI